MQGSSSFVERVTGALKLDANTYEEVEHDTGATGQALAVVALATILSGARGVGGGAAGIVGGVIWALLGWAVFSLVAYLLGTTILKGPETKSTFGEVLRALGFAYAPSMFYIFGLIPFLGIFVFLMVIFWSFAASIVALEHALDVSVVRALVIAVVSAIVIGVVLSLVFSVLGVPLPTGMPAQPIG